MARVFQRSLREMVEVLQEERIGYLGLSRDGDPYVVPLNYIDTDGRILFHCAHIGKKLDYLRANPRVCFTVGRQSGALGPHAQGAVCQTDFDSVICDGVARIMEDVTERRHLLETFNRRLSPQARAGEITLEAAAGCTVVEIRITRMTGRRERAGEARTYWEHSFGDPPGGDLGSPGACTA